MIKFGIWYIGDRGWNHLSTFVGEPEQGNIIHEFI